MESNSITGIPVKLDTANSNQSSLFNNENRLRGPTVK